MKRSLIVPIFSIFVLFGSSAVAGEEDDKEKRFKFEVGYNAVAHRTTFQYTDFQDSLVFGTKFEGNGIHSSGSIKLSDKVSLITRFDYNFRRAPRYFENTKEGNRDEPNWGERRGSSQRAESLIGFRVPKIGTLETGVARHSFFRQWRYDFCIYIGEDGKVLKVEKNCVSTLTTVSWGPAVGLTREVKLKPFVLGGGIWIYPRMAQNQNRDGYAESQTASGLKFEATCGYKLSEKVSVKGGYSFFRTFTPDPLGTIYRQINVVRSERAIIARLVYSF